MKRFMYIHYVQTFRVQNILGLTFIGFLIPTVALSKAEFSAAIASPEGLGGSLYINPRLSACTYGRSTSECSHFYTGAPLIADDYPDLEVFDTGYFDSDDVLKFRL